MLYQTELKSFKFLSATEQLGLNVSRTPLDLALDINPDESGLLDASSLRRQVINWKLSGCLCQDFIIKHWVWHCLSQSWGSSYFDIWMGSFKQTENSKEANTCKSLEHYSHVWLTDFLYVHVFLQIVKLNRRLQLLEEENKERSKREVILYSATVAFWLINTWIWFRR